MAWAFKWFPNGVDPDTGTPVLLSNTPNRSVRFRSLVGATEPPFTAVNNEVPFEAGSLLKMITVQEAEVDLRVLFQYTTQEQLWTALQGLPYAFNPLRGEGVLEVTTPAGVVRRLTCVCISGFKIDESTLQVNSVEFVLTFYANYPYWRTNTQSSASITENNTQVQWFPIFPIKLGKTGQTTWQGTFTNNGDVDVYPKIRIIGPGNAPQINNLTKAPNNSYFQLVVNGGTTIDPGTYVDIDMFNKTAVSQGGQNQLSKLRYNSTFFPLFPGQNELQFIINDANANTEFLVTWYDSYLGVI